MPAEHLLSTQDRVWIGRNQGESVPPGTFYRLSVDYNPDTRSHKVTFKQHNSATATYDLTSKPTNVRPTPLVHVELRPFIHRTYSDQPLSLAELINCKPVKYKSLKSQSISDKVYTDINQALPTPKRGHPSEQTFILPSYLTEVDGFYVKNCNILTRFPIESIIYIVNDKEADLITVVFLNEQNTISSATYRNSKIKCVGVY